MLPLRLGPPQYRDSAGFPGCRVQISSDLRRVVAFIALREGNNDDVRCIGTGFLVAYEDYRYFVTVKHNILPLEGGPYIIRFNTENGEAQDIEVDDNDNLRWYQHSDPDVDLAIAEFDYDLKKVGIDHKLLEGLQTLTKEHSFECGTFCYTVGLFQLLSGKRRNLPVVHTGNLALLPGDERIPVRDWDKPHEQRAKYVEGFLVEQQSVSGLSGAPVFARPHAVWENIPAYKKGDPKDQTKLVGLVPLDEVGLLGVWQGAWDAPPDEVRSIGLPGGVRVPVGMGVVVPAIKIKEILDMPEPRKGRAKLAEAREARSAASLDSAAPLRSAAPLANDESPTHREDFTRLVSLAARKPVSKD
jgi:hypothetical protein